jgi:hypothetical protein
MTIVPRRFMTDQIEEDHSFVKDLLSEVFDDEDSYTEWEQDFVSDISLRFEKNSNAVLTDRQREVLERIRDKPKKW